MSSVLKPAQWFAPRASIRITAYMSNRSVFFEGPGRCLALVSIQVTAADVQRSVSVEVPVSLLPERIEQVRVGRERITFIGSQKVEFPIEHPQDPVNLVNTKTISRPLPIERLRTIAACADRHPYYRILSHIWIGPHGMMAANGFVACIWHMSPFLGSDRKPVLLHSEAVRRIRHARIDSAWICETNDGQRIGVEFLSDIMGDSYIRLLDDVQQESPNDPWRIIEHLRPAEYHGRIDLSFLRRHRLTDRTLVVSNETAFLVAPDGTIEATELADVPSEWTFAIQAERLSLLAWGGKFEIGWNGRLNPVAFRNHHFTFLVMTKSEIPTIVSEAESVAV